MLMFLFIVICIVVFGFWNLVRGGVYLISGLTMIVLLAGFMSMLGGN